jgi:hypothetical protein
VSSNYTLSKCINEGEPGTRHHQPVPGADRGHHQQPSAAGHVDEHGPCVADRRHNFNLSAVLLSPGIGRRLVTLTKDWQAGIIWQARSGSPITPTTTGDFALTNVPQRPMLVPGVDPNLPEDQRTLANTGGAQSMAWFNLAAFAPNTPGAGATRRRAT